MLQCPNQGMDHNSGLTESDDVALYLRRDKSNRDEKKNRPYTIIRDEVVGR